MLIPDPEYHSLLLGKKDCFKLAMPQPYMADKLLGDTLEAGKKRCLK